MSANFKRECWIDGEYFDTITLAAQCLEVNPSTLFRGRKKGMIKIAGHIVDFIRPKEDAEP